MIYVGIDISKNKHNCVVLSQEGVILCKPFIINNTKDGFAQLRQCLDALEQNPTHIRVGLESTGHYGYNLLGFLLSCNYNIYLLNPLHTKQYQGCCSLRKTKTDTVDAKVIARFVLAHPDLRPYTMQAYHKADLKSLTRYRALRVRERSKLKCSVARLVNILFPELESAFSSLHTNCVYALLQAYPGKAQLARAHLSRLTKILQDASRGRLGETRAKYIRDLAQNSVGTTMLAKSLELRQTIKLIQTLNSEIREIDHEIKKLVAETASPITTIPGISYTIAGTILAEVGDFSRFSSTDKLLAYSGMSPTTYQSGQYNSNNHAKMEKRGSSYLRSALYHAARFVSMYEPSFATYLAKKRQEGKHYNVALSHVAKRLLRLIYAMELSGQVYQPRQKGLDC